EGRGYQPAMHLAGIVVGLRMIAVNFGDAGRLHPTLQEGVRVAHGETHVGQAALIGPAGGVTDDDRQRIGAEVVMIWPPNGVTGPETPVAAAQVKDHRAAPAEQLFPVDTAFGGEFFETRLRPLLRGQDLPCNGDAELAFDPAAFFHDEPSYGLRA